MHRVTLQLDVLRNQVALRLSTVRVPSTAQGQVAHLGDLLLLLAQLFKRVVQRVVVAASTLLRRTLLAASTVALAKLLLENRNDSGLFI